MKSNKKERLATVKATGRKYFVLYIDFGAEPIVHCWGEVSRYKNLKTYHQKGRQRFKLSDVVIEEVIKDEGLVEELFEQYLRQLKNKGLLITEAGRRCKTHTIEGRLPEAAVQAAETLGIELSQATDEELEIIMELAS